MFFITKTRMEKIIDLIRFKNIITSEYPELVATKKRGELTVQ